MRWKKGRRSSNIEDRRGTRVSRGLFKGGIGTIVLADTEDTWSTIFRNAGRTYLEPNLMLYTDRVQSACGMVSAAMGPFYCPGDN